MRAKTQQQDAGTAPENEGRTRQAEPVERVVFDDRRAEAVTQRQQNGQANASHRMDQQRSAMQAIQRKAGDEAVPNRTGLPAELKAGIESLSGISMDGVRVHYNSPQPAQLNAHAYAQGTDIHVAAGQEKHLPHEAWHVVQQAQGRVQATVQMMAGVAINDDEGLETEATVMGEKALTAGAAVAQRRVANETAATRPTAGDRQHDTARVVQQQAVVQLQFIGEAARFHVHRVGGDEHFKYGGERGTRQNFIHGGRLNQVNLQAAIDQCEESRALHGGAGDKASYDTVIAYLRSLVVVAPAAPAPPPPAPAPAPPPPEVVIPPQADFGDDDFM